MKLGLGTVRFGRDYGVGDSDRVRAPVVAEILAHAAAHGVSVLDTAAAYGESEEVLGVALGESGGGDWRIVTKTPALRPEDGRSAARAAGRKLRDGLERSLARLRRSSVYGLLVHRPDDLRGAAADDVFAAMRRCRDDGLVERIGVSVYSGDEADEFLGRFPFDLVQLPANVLDQREVGNGRLARLRRDGVEVHVRSVFLQGLLLLPLERIPPYFDPIRETLRGYREATTAAGLGAVEAAVQFAAGRIEADCLIVGAGSVAEFAEIIAAFESPSVDFDYAPFAVSDTRFIDPGRWPAAA